MDALLQGASAALSLNTVAATAAGCVAGLVFSAIPGLTFSVALALVMPFTFGMDPVPAIGLMLGVYSGGMTGGAVSAVLLGIPGTPSAAATVLDGFPMARRGDASLALGASVIASAFGGLFSLVVMLLLLEQVSSIFGCDKDIQGTGTVLGYVSQRAPKRYRTDRQTRFFLRFPNRGRTKVFAGFNFAP